VPFHSKIALLRKMNVIGNNKTYLGVHVMWSMFLPDFNQTWIFSIIFFKKSQMPNFMEISHGICDDKCGPTEMTQLTDALGDCVNSTNTTA